MTDEAAPEQEEPATPAPDEHEGPGEASDPAFEDDQGEVYTDEDP
jgi:hypothetical protein